MIVEPLLSNGGGQVWIAALSMALILLPLASALFLALVRSTQRGVAWLLPGLTAVMATATLLLAAEVFVRAAAGGSAGAVVLLFGAGEPLLLLRPDGLGLLFVILGLLVFGAVGLLALSAGREAKDSVLRKGGFWVAFLCLWSSLNLAFLAGDLLTLYLALEGMALASTPMLILSGGEPAREAARRYLRAATLASLLFFLGLIALAWSAPRLPLLALDILAERAGDGGWTRIGLLLITLALLLRAALWPLHAWLPLTHGTAQPPVSALLSGLVSKTALLILVRLWFEVFPEAIAPSAWQILGVLGSVAVLWGSLLALRQEGIKMMIAYSTVTQLGYMALIFALAAPRVADPEAAAASMIAWTGGILQILSHGLAKAGMFLAGGAIVAALGSEKREDFAGGTRRAPVAFMALALAGLSLMALPPSGGFLAKWLLLRAALDGGHYGLALVLLAGGLLAGAYLLRFLIPAFQPLPEGMEDRTPPASRLALAGLILALLSFALGLASWPVVAAIEWAAPAILSEAGS